MTVYVGGNTAIFADFAQVLSSKLPLFIGLVVVLSFLLLAVGVPSLVIPLTAAVMNLLSIGAAFGMLVAVFQWGWLGAVFGVNRAGPGRGVPPGDAVRHPVRAVHGLRGLPGHPHPRGVAQVAATTATAVRNGLAATGKTITAAALIMILVFGSFILGGRAGHQGVRPRAGRRASSSTPCSSAWPSSRR